MKPLLFLALLLSMCCYISCKKDGTPVTAPSFGSIQVKASASTPDIPAAFTIQIDGHTLDTLKGTANFDKNFPAIVGDHEITATDATGKIVYKDSVTVKLQTTAQLPSMLIKNETLLVDDYDPSVLKPAPGKMLVRFINADPALPQKMNIKISLSYMSNSTGSMMEVATGQEIKNLTHSEFSQYIELPDPMSYDPDGSFYYYILEGWNAETGEQVMSSAAGTQCYLVYYDLSYAMEYIPNNVMTIEIPGISGPSRIGNILFQRAL